MKHICFFLDNLGTVGGIERITISLANELAKRNYKVILISLGYFNKPYFEIDESIKTYHLTNKKNIKNSDDIFSVGNKFNKLKVYSPLVLKLNKIIAKNKIDILISSGVQLNLFCLTVKILNKKIKIISWEHMNATIQWYRWILGRKLAKKYADAIVVLTNQDKELYLEEGISRSPISVINNFMDKYPSEVAPLKSKNVLALGRFATEKGFDILIDVWENVKQNPISQDWILQIVGDGIEKENLKRKILEKNLSESLFLRQATSDVSKYYLDASIYVMSSRFEGFGLVLMEAQCFGIPAISFDCISGPREIIKDGEDGFLIPMGDNKEMEQKIIELMDNEKLRIQMGREARINSERFKKENIVNQWVNLFDKL